MRRWVTCGSTTFEAMVNPLAAACAKGFVPDEYVILSNDEIEETVERATSLATAIVAEYEGALDTSIESLDTERDFEAIGAYYHNTIQTADDTDVAVDVTPGRKFMSSIAFQAGFQYDADHVYYLFLDSNDYYGRVYDDIPAPAVDLIDFTTVMP